MVVLALLALTACSDRGEEVRQASLAVLVNQAEQLDGSRVATQGWERHFEDPLHYWIEDEDLNRVEIFPHERIAPHLGETVRVVGVFEYSSTKGRRMTLESVEPFKNP
ncbi:glucose-inhibited division protein B [Halomonas sp. MCCC 1A11036]|uniref:Glucose-inhibited division protein B n=2 Tax=Billgrantia zhangzhouensis TaxID=2733481 RepID=A0ABS9AE04_9GAMM|nr:glucose-inhibited division protein B [Halomonas zhangzhouensis]